MPYNYEYYLFSDTKVEPTHIVKFRLKHHKPEDINSADCEGWGQEAVYYWKNDAWFLWEDWDLKIHVDNTDDNKNRVLSKHIRNKISEKDKYNFGKWSTHRERDIEFYCQTWDKPIWVDWLVIGDHSGENANNHAHININEVYDDAVHECNLEDVNLVKKKNLINNNIQQIKDKIKELEQWAKEVEEEVYRLLKNTLKELSIEFKKKNSLLKSDLMELWRQNKEIEHVQGYIREQAEKMTPVNFLKIWNSFKNYKKKLLEKKTTITDIHVQLKLDGKPIITSDSGHRNIDIEDSNNEKKNVLDFTKRSIANQITQKSTSFRSQLINRAAKTGLKEYNPFITGGGYMKSNLVPANPSRMPNSNKDPNNDFKIGDHFEKPDEKSKIKKKIVDLLHGYEKKLEEFQVDSIATEAVQRSLYGVFAKNYHAFKNNVVPSVLEDTFKKVF